MTAAWLPYFDDGEYKNIFHLSVRRHEPLNIRRLFDSKHALVYCASFRIQPDIN